MSPDSVNEKRRLSPRDVVVGQVLDQRRIDMGIYRDEGRVWKTSSVAAEARRAYRALRKLPDDATAGHAYRVAFGVNPTPNIIRSINMLASR